MVELAKAGNAEAQLVLGLNLLNGTGVAMNIERAAGWLERAANGGQPVAQETHGRPLSDGNRCRSGHAKSDPLVRNRRPLGNVKAMANLGKAYAGGWSEGTDFSKAAQWFCVPPVSATSMPSSILPFCTSAARAFPQPVRCL